MTKSEWEQKVIKMQKEGEAQDTAIRLVKAERARQQLKWGTQEHPMSDWIGILGEEFGELSEAVIETKFQHHPDRGGYDNMLTEATHVTAVALQIMEYLIRNKEELENAISKTRPESSHS